MVSPEYGDIYGTRQSVKQKLGLRSKISVP